MTSAPEMRSPAPALASGMDRAQVVRNEAPFTIAKPEVQANFDRWFINQYGVPFDEMPDAWRAEFFRSHGSGPELTDKWCGICDHFQSSGFDDRYGECRAALPKINSRDWTRRWPCVARAQWCSNFKGGL